MEQDTDLLKRLTSLVQNSDWKFLDSKTQALWVRTAVVAEGYRKCPPKVEWPLKGQDPQRYYCTDCEALDRHADHCIGCGNTAYDAGYANGIEAQRKADRALCPAQQEGK